MPKDTFYNLKNDKKEEIENALIKEFENKSIFEATVKDIVDSLGISRGSFYQYFDSLEESYFYILEKEANKIHTIFINCFRECKGNIKEALNSYGDLVAKEIFTNGKYLIYRNRYLNWTQKLEKEWNLFLKKDDKKFDQISRISSPEEMYFVKAIVHSLIQRLFLENWSKEEFLEHYNKNIKWIIGGIL